MASLDNDKQNPVMTAKAEIKNVQLNEKVNEKTYQIVHPETNADQVITNSLKRFVSDADKEKWNACADNNQASLQYLGEYKSSTEYNKYDVVYYDTTTTNPLGQEDVVRMFYICVKDNVMNKVPSYEAASTEFWVNLDFRSYLSSKANAVRIDKSVDNNEYLIAFANYNDSNYNSIRVNDNFKFNPQAGTLTVTKLSATEVIATRVSASESMFAPTFNGDLVGTADIATNYMPSAEGATKASIAAKFDEIDGKFNGLSQSGTTTKNPLYIKDENGNKLTDKEYFNGEEEVIATIKQSYATTDIVDLLENNKIKTTWLPDSIVGQVEYKGTWAANAQGSAISGLEKGWYYISSEDGNYAPDGTLMNITASTQPYFYQTGDWAIYNGTSWDKVDNTDAVTMVNGQIGDVETYKGDWLQGTDYHKGDIVKRSGKLYLCSNSHIAGTDFSDTNWLLFGRQYVGIDGIKVDGDNIGHDVQISAVSTKELLTLKSGDSFNMPIITRDDYGHVTGLEVQPIQLGQDFTDTTREIQLNGSKILEGSGSTRNKALNFNGDSTYIELKYENDVLTVNHKVTGQGTKDLQVEAKDALYAGQSFKVPSIKVDAAGHVELGELKEITLAESPVVHSHFNVTTDASGAKVIGAYDATSYSGLANKDGKFYLGTAAPESTSQLNFNGKFNASELLQKGNKVLDETVSINLGTNYSGAALTAAFDKDTNSFVAPDTGVGAGTYSVVHVNEKGLVTAGGHMIEFGSEEDADPSDSLAYGGLFFRVHNTEDKNGAVSA